MPYKKATLTRAPNRSIMLGMTNEITWQDRIQQIKDAGMTNAMLARAVGITPQGLCDIAAKRTIEPRGMVAVKLHNLHLRMIRKAA
jgi:hypothetical protein